MASPTIPLDCETVYGTFISSFLRPAVVPVPLTLTEFINIVEIESRCADEKFAIVAFPNITDRHDNLP
jgi:hypothetical protein